MKKPIILSAALLLSSTTASADAFGNLENAMKNIGLTGTSNAEMVIPFAKTVDTNGDTFPDTVRIRFDTYEAGTSNLLGSTATRGTSLPFPSCTNPDPTTIRPDLAMRIVGTSTSNRAGLLVGINIMCEEIGGSVTKNSYKTILYSGNVATGTSWMKTFNLEAVGLNGYDFDGDTTKEYMLGMRKTVGQYEKIKIVWVNPSDGVIEDNGDYVTAINP